MKINFRQLKLIDWLLYILPVILAILGIAIIYSLSYYSNIQLFYNQIIFFVIAIVAMVVFSFIDYRQLKSASTILYIIGMVLLILVFILGKTTFGATSWIDLGFYDFQPSEFFKLILVIVLSTYLCDKIGNLTWKNILIASLIMIVPVLMVALQPDLGTASIIVLTFLILLFSAKPSKKQILTFLIIIAVAIPLSWLLLKDYQRQRLLTFMDPTSDPYGSGYNVSQALIAVGNGGVFGRGFGHGPQSQLNFLPVAHTDFIFAGIAEAMGFAGSIVLIIFYAVIIIKIVSIAKKAKDNFGMLLAIGIATIIFMHAVINIGMNIGLMPVTGIPLPFISAGGTSLVLMFICIGIVQSISIRHKKISFK